MNFSINTDRKVLNSTEAAVDGSRVFGKFIIAKAHLVAFIDDEIAALKAKRKEVRSIPEKRLMEELLGLDEGVVSETFKPPLPYKPERSVEADPPPLGYTLDQMPDKPGDVS